MMRKKARTIIISRILVSLYVASLLIVSFHHHPLISDYDSQCYDCQNHVHSGHFVQDAGSWHDCLLCHFTHAEYLVPFVIVPLVPFVYITSNHCKNTIFAGSSYNELGGVRGPPSVFFS